MMREACRRREKKRLFTPGLQYEQSGRSCTKLSAKLNMDAELGFFDPVLYPAIRISRSLVNELCFWVNDLRLKWPGFGP